MWLFTWRSMMALEDLLAFVDFFAFRFFPPGRRRLLEDNDIMSD